MSEKPAGGVTTAIPATERVDTDAYGGSQVARAPRVAMDVVQLTADGDTTTDTAAAGLPEATVYEPGRFNCNAYLALGDRPTLLDAGRVEGVVDAVRAHTDRLDAVVITHQHGDHVAQLEAVIDAFDADCHAYAPHPSRTAALADGDAVRIGDARFEAVHTPGHADDHLAFVGETVLFSGDVVAHNDEAFDYGTFGSTGGPGPARDRLVESIRRLLDRLPDGVESLYAGHGDVFHGDVRDAVETALERAERDEPKYPDR